MKEQTRRYILESLEIIDDKIEKKEDNVRGGLYMFGVGMAGMVYGILTKSDSSLMSGMLLSGGSLIFRAINRISLESLRVEQYSYRYALKHDNVNEYHSESNDSNHYKGKHFKR